MVPWAYTSLPPKPHFDLLIRFAGLVVVTDTQTGTQTTGRRNMRTNSLHLGTIICCCLIPTLKSSFRVEFIAPPHIVHSLEIPCDSQDA